MDSEGKAGGVAIAVHGCGNSSRSILTAIQDAIVRIRNLFRARCGDRAPAVHSMLKASSDTLENEFLRVKIDPQTGCMTSLFDKRSGTESLAPAETDTGGPKTSICGNLLQTFVDKPKQWDAWNIDADFEKQHWDLDKADEVKLIESGPLRAIIQIKNHFQNSTFVRDITLYAGIPRVDVKMQAEWHEKHILLKVAFPAQRAQRQSNIRNSIRLRRAPYHAQHAGGAGAV